MYYHHDMNTDEIARALAFSRAKVSRLLNYAREQGIVEVRIVDQRQSVNPTVAELLSRYRGLHTFRVAPVTAGDTGQERQRRVAEAAAGFLCEDVFQPGAIVGLAAGEIIAATAGHLPQKKIHGITFVQLHGHTTAGETGIGYVDRVVAAFALKLHGDAVLFPVPRLFGSHEIRDVVWQDPSVQVVREYQMRCDVFVFPIESVSSIAGSAEPPLANSGLPATGSIGTIIFDRDGTADSFAVNRRATGPELDRYRRVRRSVCIASGNTPIAGLHAALKAGYVSDLIIDEYSAGLLFQYLDSPQPETFS